MNEIESQTADDADESLLTLLFCKKIIKSEVYVIKSRCNLLEIENRNLKVEVEEVRRALQELRSAGNKINVEDFLIL